MKVILKDVRIAFPRLWEPEAYKGQGKKRYNATFLVEPGSSNDKAIRDALQAVAQEAFREKAQAHLKSMAGNSNKFCYQDGEAKSLKYPEFSGQWLLSANRNEEQGAPKVVNRDKSVVTRESGIIYSGCRVNASVDIWLQTGEYSGYRATLIAVQFVRDDEPTGAAAATDSDFEVLEPLSQSDEDLFDELNQV